MYAAAAFLPVVFAGLIGIDSNFSNEWCKFLICSVIGSGLAYKGYEKAPNKNIYLASTVPLYAAAILVPGFSHKIFEYNNNNK